MLEGGQGDVEGEPVMVDDSVAARLGMFTY